MTSWQDRYAGALMNTFGPPKFVLTRGQGAHVWDEHGKEYVDLLGGIAVNSLGHAHPAIVEAVGNQLQTLGHISNFFASQPQIELAEKLLELLTPVVEEGALAPAFACGTMRTWIDPVRGTHFTALPIRFDKTC